ncbi:MAG: RelA/SpoT domain-containing protein [Alphaproteobacteria bacterium]|nr:RelA/SpoT domain-containing protein [Alphaproteobacteria bacterium]MBN2779459.1 RelA/SpoT domain-containing protein [Alphaproteobacteria bacterium]
MSKRLQIYPIFSKKRVDLAGKNVRENTATREDYDIIENWRASHVHVLNTWSSILKNRINKSNIKVVYAQRLKRKITIFDKLSNRQSGMSLSRMHDIAGCRLIFKSYKDLINYRSSLHKTKKMLHSLIKQDEKPYPYNYIQTPQDSGYRGIHDVYKYKSKKGKDRSPKWDGLRIEIQYRTIFQHAWATAVEVADFMTQNRTKFGEGSEDQKEFFRLSSEIIARVYENEKSCKPKLSDADLIREFIIINKKTNLLTRLRHLKLIKKSDAIKSNILIIKLTFSQPGGPPASIVEPQPSLSAANKEYFRLEKENPDADIVLVKSDAKSIKDAFRNYFADTKDFVSYIEEGLKELRKRNR